MTSHTHYALCQATLAQDGPRRRLTIVLASADHLPVLEIANRVGVSRPMVWRWQRRYAEEGLEGLLRDKTRPPGIPPVPQAKVHALVERTLRAPPGAVTHWTGRAMAKAMGLSLRTVQRIWSAHGLQPHRIRTFKRSTDPDFAAKLDDVVGLYMNPPRHERAYWTDRNRELEDVVSLDGAVCGDIQLDLVAEVRAAIVHDLAMHEIRVTNILDLHGRFAMYREADVDDPRVDDALFRDIAAMAVAAKSQPSTARPHAPSDAADRIQTALNADPSRSDRDIARSLQCSPTTVGKARAALGLRSSTRAVSRGGQQFKMHVAAAQPS